MVAVVQGHGLELTDGGVLVLFHVIHRFRACILNEVRVVRFIQIRFGQIKVPKLNVVGTESDKLVIEIAHRFDTEHIVFGLDEFVISGGDQLDVAIGGNVESVHDDEGVCGQQNVLSVLRDGEMAQCTFKGGYGVIGETTAI